MAQATKTKIKTNMMTLIVEITLKITIFLLNK